jgi:hypothetical protein
VVCTLPWSDLLPPHEVRPCAARNGGEEGEALVCDAFRRVRKIERRSLMFAWWKDEA